MKNTIYLVTGGAGYLGGEICRQLVSRGDRVRAFILPGDKAADKLPDGVEKIEGDLCDKASLERLFTIDDGEESIVLHIASIVTVAPEYNERVMNVNVGGTKNIIECCLSHPECKKLVYCSSTGAIPETGQAGRIKEVDRFDEALVPGCYSKSKALASQAVLDAVKEHGLDACIVHPSGIMGPGDRGEDMIGRTFVGLIKGSYPVGIDGTFNLCDVRDLAAGTIGAADRGRAGECYILANEEVSFREFAKMIAEAAGKKPIKHFLSIKTSYKIASVCEKISKGKGLLAIMSTFTIDSLARNNSFDWSKAKNELGYSTRPYSETIKDEMAWMKKSGKI